MHHVRVEFILGKQIYLRKKNVCVCTLLLIDKKIKIFYAEYYFI